MPGQRAVAVAHSPEIEAHVNPKIDVAAIGLNGIMLLDLNNPYIKTIPIDMLYNDELINERDAMEQVTFIGYPNGLYDSVNQTPIARRGWTATPISFDYEGEPIFLIDASVFEGSSWSPAFLVDAGGFTNMYGDLVYDGPKIALLGIVAAMYSRKIEAEFILVGSHPHVVMDQSLNLGVVYKTRTIRETIDQFLAKKGYSRVPPNMGGKEQP